MERMVVACQPVRVGLKLLAFALVFFAGLVSQGQAAPLRVDAELVLSVDVSNSMQPSELALQRQGYAAAFRSPEVIKAILGGVYGRIAVTYVEWGSSNIHRIVVPWTLVDSAATARAVAYRLEHSKIVRMYRTSISGAIRDAMRAFGENQFRGLRRIIDISGDGPNNQGGSVTVARDNAVRQGVTINGLPLMLNRPMPAGAGDAAMPPIDKYYADCVAGGPRAFVLPVVSWQQFPQAVRRKLVLEMSNRNPAIRRAAFTNAPQPMLPGRGVDCEAAGAYPG